MRISTRSNIGNRKLAIKYISYKIELDKIL